MERLHLWSEHTPAPPERSEEQQQEDTGVCVIGPEIEGGSSAVNLLDKQSEPQLTANFSNLIAAKSLTSPPMRFVA